MDLVKYMYPEGDCPAEVFFPKFDFPYYVCNVEYKSKFKWLSFFLRKKTCLFVICRRHEKICHDKNIIIETIQSQLGNRAFFCQVWLTRIGGKEEKGLNIPEVGNLIARSDQCDESFVQNV